ncbi:hypothetical protein, partial [Klebsiella variicola]|uniref:hypothetical protein n=1 Tax=Klebsiella variicola TaxID=244366 RepID=UPI001D122A05
IPSLIVTISTVTLLFSSVFVALTGREQQLCLLEQTTHDDTGHTFQLAAAQPGATGAPSGGHH